MDKYKDFQPTPFDPKGHGLDDKQEWLVFPVTQTRDSDALSRSNFEVSEEEFKKLDPEGTHYENHRFGHWGPGWFEIILIDPNAEKLILRSEELIRALEEYPILDEEHYYQLEADENGESEEE